MSLFLEETKRLLKQRPKNITLALIAEETGLKDDWLQSLLYKDIDAGVKKVETLYNYLADKPFSFDGGVTEQIAQ